MGGHVDIAELERLQSELQQRERTILEAGYLRRTNGLEAVRDAVRRLGELGSPGGVLARAPRELGNESQLDRILLSEITAAQLTPLTLWERDRERPPVPDITVTLDYPLIEHEVVRERRPTLVVLAAVGNRSPRALADAFGWSSYVVAPIVVEGDAVGMLHADANVSGRALDELDCELLALACTGVGEGFNRAVLREVLRRHRAEVRMAMSTLAGTVQATPPLGTSKELSEPLTAREREVLALMARGQTNAKIAIALAVRQGTVKYHVKNVLRKLGARSRADAVARYARATAPTF